MKGIQLVLGANGHLGQNLVRRLRAQGATVRASVRAPEKAARLQGLACEIVIADLLAPETLRVAMRGVGTLYLAAASYRSWARDVQNEIIAVNVDGTRNALQAAAAAHVRRVVYVSSTFALDHDTGSGWNQTDTDPYGRSKTHAEKLALELAAQLDLSLVSVLPSGMVGPHCYDHLTPTMELLSKILANQLPVDPGFRFNFVDIRDVCDAMIVAAQKGTNGERYILAQQAPITSTEVLALAQSLFPHVRRPRRAPTWLLYLVAWLGEMVSRLTNRKPLMLRSQVRKFRRSRFHYDTSKARTELGFSPRPQRQALAEALEAMHSKRPESLGASTAPSAAAKAAGSNARAAARE